MKYASLALAVIALAWAAFQQVTIGQLRAQQQELLVKISKPEEKPEHYELAAVMGSMHLYLNKLWFAGKAQNWELAQFYTHELEESLESLYEAEVIDEGIEVSKLAKVMMEQPFEAIEQSVRQEQLPAFETSYKQLINTCNQCHQSAKHGFIRLQVPQTPVFDSQLYEKPN